MRVARVILKSPRGNADLRGELVQLGQAAIRDHVAPQSGRPSSHYRPVIA
jgi:hypothetical protein